MSQRKFNLLPGRINFAPDVLFLPGRELPGHEKLQEFLAHQHPPPRRTLQEHNVLAPVVVLGGRGGFFRARNPCISWERRSGKRDPNPQTPKQGHGVGPRIGGAHVRGASSLYKIAALASIGQSQCHAFPERKRGWVVTLRFTIIEKQMAADL